MIAVFYMVVAGILGALSNLCMRQSLDKSGSPRLFFIMQLLLTFLVTLCLCPIQNSSYSLDIYTLCIAVACGLSLGVMKYLISHALVRGPSNLTFAAVNAATIMPGVVIALLFGSLINFEYTLWNFAGSLLVIGGLFWASHERLNVKKAWIMFAGGAFFVHFFYLFLTQSYFITTQHQFFTFANESEWFFPLVFIAAATLHISVYYYSERKVPRLEELSWGILGGIFNGTCAYFFGLGAEIAKGKEHGFIFPIFSVALIISCNLWANWFYEEKINWPAHSLCITGLIVGMA